MIFAVTGGLGTGKSTVAKVIAATLGAAYLDTDQVCRMQMQPGNSGYQRFVAAFGRTFLLADGGIDRDRLRSEVFSNPDAKNKLESILHPLVRDKVVSLADSCNSNGTDLVIEVPLLFEVGWRDRYDYCVVVYVPEEMCIERVKKRDRLAVQQIREIIDSQMNIEQKRKLADYVIDNSTTFAGMICQVAFWKRNVLGKPIIRN